LLPFLITKYLNNADANTQVFQWLIIIHISTYFFFRSGILQQDLHQWSLQRLRHLPSVTNKKEYINFEIRTIFRFIYVEGGPRKVNWVFVISHEAFKQKWLKKLTFVLIFQIMHGFILIKPPKLAIQRNLARYWYRGPASRAVWIPPIPYLKNKTDSGSCIKQQYQSLLSWKISRIFHFREFFLNRLIRFKIFFRIFRNPLNA